MGSPGVTLAGNCLSTRREHLCFPLLLIWPLGRLAKCDEQENSACIRTTSGSYHLASSRILSHPLISSRILSHPLVSSRILSHPLVPSVGVTMYSEKTGRVCRLRSEYVVRRKGPRLTLRDAPGKDQKPEGIVPTAMTSRSDDFLCGSRTYLGKSPENARE